MPIILSIIDALQASQGFVRPMRESEEVLNAGLIISTGVKGGVGETVHIQSLVLRTSGIASQHPYLVEVWVDKAKDYGSRVIKEAADCGCPAGQSQKCKHILAVLLYLTRVEEESLEDLSCTDIEQQWGSLKASKLKEYEAKPLRALCHVQTQKDIYVSSMPVISKEMEKRWCDRLSRGNNTLVCRQMLVAGL